MADHVLDMELGNRTGCAPVTDDLISALAVATGIAVGDWAADEEVDTEGETAAEALGDVDAIGPVGPQAAIRATAASPNTAATLVFMNLL